MTLRKAHGAGSSALVRVETAPVDELPVGVPASAREASPNERGTRGRFAHGNRIAVDGGKATAGKTRLAAKLGLSKLAEDADFAPYRRAASSFRRAQCAELARVVGGGVCGPAPSSVVASAALALAWSRYFSDKAAATGDADYAIKSAQLADKSRQHLLTAHELAAREATARAKSGEQPTPSWLEPDDGGKR